MKISNKRLQGATFELTVVSPKASPGFAIQCHDGKIRYRFGFEVVVAKMNRGYPCGQGAQNVHELPQRVPVCLGTGTHAEYN